MTFISTLKTACISASLLALVSCGQKPNVQDVSVEPRIEGQDIIVDVQADLVIGNLAFPTASLPIILPKDGREIGQVNMNPNNDGTNTLGVEINVTQAANLSLQQSNLPNGSELPIIGQREIIEIPLPNMSKLYLSISADQIALGVAVPIKTFDGLGSSVGTASLFPVFQQDGIFGAAGLFTSKQAGQNGIGLFVDVTSVTGDLMLNQKAAYLPQLEQAPLNYSSIVPSSRKKKKIDRALYSLHRKRKSLKLH